MAYSSVPMTRFLVGGVECPHRRIVESTSKGGMRGVGYLPFLFAVFTALAGFSNEGVCRRVR